MRAPDIRTTPMADIQIPVEFEGLYDLAYNLWWSWNPRAMRLFERIDPARWNHDHNPVELLINVEPHRWDDLLSDSAFAGEYAAVLGSFKNYLGASGDTWFRSRYPDFERGPIAYFSTEFGWHECLSIYSGGLGVLAGDHCKSASDLGVPFVGMGLMYRRGYFHQTIDADGHQQHHYHVHDFRRLPILPVSTPSGRAVMVTVPFPGRDIHLRVWKASVGRVPVLLLDSDVRENDPADRPITSILYIRGREMRFCQEMLLGMGGVRALQALGIEPSVWHMNEGHSALLAFQRIQDHMEETGCDFASALDHLRSSTMFTTHTPVPAGNEVFDLELVNHYLADRMAGWKIDVEDLRGLGNAERNVPGFRPGDPSSRSAGPSGAASAGAFSTDQTDAAVEGQFNLTAFAIRSSRMVNGVSKLHGEVARGLWKHLAGTTESEHPETSIGHVTNGVHAPTWIGPEIAKLLAAHLGSHVVHNLDHPSFANAVRSIPDADVWNAHLEQKRRLIHESRRHMREQAARHGRSPDELRDVDDLLAEDAFTIGFARRFATYKRAALIFSDRERLRALVCNDDRPVQIVFAGKAHPADRPGQALIQEIVQASQEADLHSRIVFVEDYDMRVGRHLTQGVDLWLNNPRRPQEASGTSGMKAAMNGVLNFSILDGWWVEGFETNHGWIIGSQEENPDTAKQDAEDAESLYATLANQIVPAYYARNDQGIPVEWIGRMKEAIASLAPSFNTARMVREYTEQFYVPVSDH